ncbi:hypothetical protein IM660_07195 [Ruania alkalisoli]|uniref:Uncharacterized protein n=1 Tax=Ruania alkalisoli TaxID=2779775 RepID=A0A7M1SWS8_9MICO|nr:hypothetical protein [Ruania alkalisoli]QOR72019.1 hypothetical protein IM660_07195 [Ruania alkalisoli]
MAAGVALIASSVIISSSSAGAEELAPDTEVHEAPDAESTDAEWNEWADALEEEVRTTDWAADSAARGCELVSMDIRHTTVPEERGGPAGLTVPVVERTEDCTETTSISQSPSTQNRTTATYSAMASACAGTSGPGTICLSRSGSYVNYSFTYHGSSSPTGFLRLYERSSSSGCGTGTTVDTSVSWTFGSGQTRSWSTPTGYDHYAASFWRKTTFGHTNWGTVCDTL